MKPLFSLGQIVTRKQFTDGFKKFPLDIHELIVTDIRYVETATMPPYFRIKAENQQDSRIYYEGAERFFEGCEPSVREFISQLFGDNETKAAAVSEKFGVSLSAAMEDVEQYCGG